MITSDADKHKVNILIEYLSSNIDKVRKKYKDLTEDFDLGYIIEALKARLNTFLVDT